VHVHQVVVTPADDPGQAEHPAGVDLAKGGKWEDADGEIIYPLVEDSVAVTDQRDTVPFIGQAFAEMGHLLLAAAPPDFCVHLQQVHQYSSLSSPGTVLGGIKVLSTGYAQG
jgi:hypothetical protein